jgi:hypothetical protein
MTGGWRKLHNEEMNNLNYKVEEDEVGGACGTNRAEEEVYWWESQRERDH